MNVAAYEMVFFAYFLWLERWKHVTWIGGLAYNIIWGHELLAKATHPFRPRIFLRITIVSIIYDFTNMMSQ